MKDSFIELIWDQIGTPEEKALISRYAGPENHYHHCSTILIQIQKGKGLLVKSVEPDALDACQLPERKDLADYIAEVMRGYYSWLKTLKINVPTRHEILVVGKADGIFRVIEIADYCGEDLFVILGKEPRKALELIGDILKNIRCVFESKEVGIDPHPANFCRNSEGTFYVDYFPGRYRFGDTFLVGFPQPDDPRILQYHLERYYSTFGILRLLRFNLKRIAAGLEPVLFEAMKKAGVLTPKIKDQFNDLPDREVAELLKTGRKVKIADMINSLGLQNVDDLREIAAAIIPDNPVLLTQLFNLSHQDFRIPVQKREKLLLEFKQRLCQAVREHA